MKAVGYKKPLPITDATSRFQRSSSLPVSLPLIFTIRHWWKHSLRKESSVSLTIQKDLMQHF